MKKVVLLALACTLFAAPVTAKEGLYVGAYALPSTEVSGLSGIDSGSGYGFRAGFGFNRYFAIEGSYETAEQDVSGGRKADLTGWAADVKVNFPLTSLDRREIMTVEPYLRFGYADYELEIPSAGSASGNGGRFGIGIELYLFRELSVSAGWSRTKISLDAPGEPDARIKTIDVGLNYHFM